jgi:acetyl esterase
MSLHPKLAELLQLAQANQTPRFHQGTPEQARALLAASAAALGQGPELHDVRDLQIQVRWGQIPGRLYRSAAHESGLIVYLHGGGWVLGAMADFDALCRQLCQQSQCAVLMVDYRLAPEYPYPAAREDALDAIKWAWQSRKSLVDAALPLIIAGDSAGGNLAAVAVNELTPHIPIAKQLLVYPVTNCDFNTESYRQFSDGYPLMREDMQWFFQHYAAQTHWADPYISPLNHKRLAQLPDTWIAVADHDVLRDDGIAYAQALKDSGTEVDLRIYPGMTHGFIRMANLIGTAQEAVSDMARAAYEGCKKAAH